MFFVGAFSRLTHKYLIFTTWGEGWLRGGGEVVKLVYWWSWLSAIHFLTPELDVCGCVRRNVPWFWDAPLCSVLGCDKTNWEYESAEITLTLKPSNGDLCIIIKTFDDSKNRDWAVDERWARFWRVVVMIIYHNDLNFSFINFNIMIFLEINKTVPDNTFLFFNWTDNYGLVICMLKRQKLAITSTFFKYFTMFIYFSTMFS